MQKAAHGDDKASLMLNVQVPQVAPPRPSRRVDLDNGVRGATCGNFTPNLDDGVGGATCGNSTPNLGDWIRGAIGVRLHIKPG